jgi:hypothetical protein
MGLGSGIRDPGSGKNLFRIPDPGFKKHRIRIRNTASYSIKNRLVVVVPGLWIRIRIGSVFNWKRGSGSVFGIRIQEGKNDPKK